MQRLVGGLRDWKRVWCVMRQNHLRCWSCPEDVGKKMPLDTIDLTQVSQLARVHVVCSIPITWGLQVAYHV